VGQEAALEILDTRLPHDARSHQFAHLIDAALYEVGFEGIVQCTPLLSGGCYHGFMIRLIEERGLDALPKAVAECKQGLAMEQPGNCAHASGHGLFSFVGYEDLPRAFRLCGEYFRGRDRDECFNGVFMQNNFGEFNAPPADRWYRAEDPMYPCNEPFVLAASAHDACWLMQSQLSLQNDSYPQFGHSVAMVGSYCSTLSRRDRLTCLTGISRQLQQLYGTEAAIRRECGALARPLAQRWCLYFAAQTAYYFGERSAASWPVTLCLNDTHPRECALSTMLGIVWTFEDPAARERACHELPPQYDRAECMRLALETDSLYEILNGLYESEADAR
jgi:hypothetical protein